MKYGRHAALATGLAASLICATVFWLIWQTSTSQTFFSFWNRPLAVRTGLTVLFIIFGSRAVIWHTYKVSAYRVERGRGSIRILPLSFGLAVFAMVTVWLVVTTLAETFYRGYRLLVAPEGADTTILILPLVFFVQFLFSKSTIVWLLTAGVVWTAFAQIPVTRKLLLSYFEDERALVPVGQDQAGLLVLYGHGRRDHLRRRPEAGGQRRQPRLVHQGAGVLGQF